MGLVLVMAWRASAACSRACCSAICAVRCAVRAWSTCCAVTKPRPSSGCIRASVLVARARCASAVSMPLAAASALEVCDATWSAVRASCRFQAAHRRASLVHVHLVGFRVDPEQHLALAHLSGCRARRARRSGR